VAAPSGAEEAIRRADVVVDALVGYSLRGAPRGRAAKLTELSNEHARGVLSLDVPSGLNATTGEAPGVVVHPDRTLTLALPKTGLASISSELYVGDIGIPPEEYQPLGLSFEPFFRDRYWISVHRQRNSALDRRDNHHEARPCSGSCFEGTLALQPRMPEEVLP
jgi:hypothetical protein